MHLKLWLCFPERHPESLVHICGLPAARPELGWLQNLSLYAEAGIEVTNKGYVETEAAIDWSTVWIIIVHCRQGCLWAAQMPPLLCINWKQVLWMHVMLLWHCWLLPRTLYLEMLVVFFCLYTFAMLLQPCTSSRENEHEANYQNWINIRKKE